MIHFIFIITKTLSDPLLPCGRGYCHPERDDTSGWKCLLKRQSHFNLFLWHFDPKSKSSRPALPFYYMSQSMSCHAVHVYGSQSLIQGFPFNLSPWLNVGRYAISMPFHRFLSSISFNNVKKKYVWIYVIWILKSVVYLITLKYQYCIGLKL